MRKKSDYAIVISCTPGYGFGMISTMNAQNYFGTDADWEIAYESYTEAERDAISNAFRFNVNWTPVSELIPMVVDRRTINREFPLERFWLAYWLLAHKLLKEKKYKAVCVIQADTFVFVNLDVYFKIAEAGILVCSEHAFSWTNAEDLPFGNDKGVWDRSMCGVFDAINFLGQQFAQLPFDAADMQAEDAFQGESNHSVTTFNRSVCRHGQKDKILRLDRRLWVCDCIWPETTLRIQGDRIFNSSNIQLNSWHCRWWQQGRTQGEWAASKPAILQNKENAAFLASFDLLEHNYNTVKSFMERFNNMTPAVRSEAYLHEPVRRPRYELGEQ